MSTTGRHVPTVGALVMSVGSAVAWAQVAGGSRVVEPLDVVRGSAFVLPVSGGLAGGGAAGGELVVTMDGARVPAMVTRVEFAPLILDANAGPTIWTGSTTAWMTSVYDPSMQGEGAGGEAGAGRPTTLLAVIEPVDALSGGEVFEVRVGKGEPEAFAVQALPSVEELIEAQPELRSTESVFWRAGMLDVTRAERVEPFVRAMAADPVSRWRAKLLMNGLRPRSAMALEFSEEGTPLRSDDHDWMKFEDSAMEAVATQIEEKWRVGLLRLAAVDLGMAVELKAALGRCVEFDLGEEFSTLAPVAPGTPDAMAAVLSALTEGSVFDSERAKTAVREFLDARAKAAAFVIDDAAVASRVVGQASDGKGPSTVRARGVFASLALVNLGDVSAMGSARSRAVVKNAMPGGEVPKPDVSEIVPIPAQSSSQVLVSVGGGGPVEAQIGKERSGQVVLGTVAVRPPGLSTGPFVGDWTEAAVVGQRAAEVGAGWATGALLTRTLSGMVEIVVECRGVAGVGMEELEAITVSSAMADGRQVLQRVTLDGRVVDLLNDATLDDGTPVQDVLGTRVDVARGSNGYTVRIDLPAGVLRPDGTVKLGLQRVDALGRRSCWPRAAMPWQRGPGHVMVDVAAWGPMIGVIGSGFGSGLGSGFGENAVRSGGVLEEAQRVERGRVEPLPPMISAGAKRVEPVVSGTPFTPIGAIGSGRDFGTKEANAGAVKGTVDAAGRKRAPLGPLLVEPAPDELLEAERAAGRGVRLPRELPMGLPPELDESVLRELERARTAPRDMGIPEMLRLPMGLPPELDEVPLPAMKPSAVEVDQAVEDPEPPPSAG